MKPGVIPLRASLSYAVSGGAAAMLVLALLLLLHVLLGAGRVPFVPLEVADVIIETTPADNALLLQRIFGAAALPTAILGGIMLVASLGMISGAMFGLLCGASLPAAVIAAALLHPTLVYVCFFQNRPLSVSLLPLLLTGPAIAWLTRRDAMRPDSNWSRRRILRRLAMFSLGGIALAVVKGLPTVISELGALKAAGSLFDFTPPAPRAVGFDIPDLAPEVTPVADFYKMRKFPTPIPAVPANWRLVIDGLVGSPVTLSLDDLLALPRTDVMLTRQCISNPVGGSLISTALMSGVTLGDILTRVGARPDATEVVFYGRDGYTEKVAVDYGRAHGLITYAMNGVMLPEVHGAPARIEMPGLYGFKSLKWLDRIEVIEGRHVAIWEAQGWTATPIVKTMSRIDTVQPTADGALMAGIAFAGMRSISRVEVQVNGGEWQPAALHAPPLAATTWMQWRLATSLQDAVRVRVRAVDGDSQPQIETDQKQFPDGATGLHTVER